MIRLFDINLNNVKDKEELSKMSMAYIEKKSKEYNYLTDIANKNVSNNRYSNIKPYDHNIVRLKNNKYINASFMKDKYNNHLVN